ncbi:Pigv [Symbiodinium natans]|uniref:GPI mannosyltransferase 2 n=1 Tax=Symbiodinium natans TaxID=878477 RepID=A0A812UYX2_9DINO|nr:Pigv [Symbiodinium natans]
MNVKVRPLTTAEARPVASPSGQAVHSVRNTAGPEVKSRWKRWRSHSCHSSPDFRVIRFAVASRVTVIILSVLSDWTIPDHEPDPSVARLRVSGWLSAFTRWDAARFTAIGMEGYMHEEDYAFMPVLPMAISISARAAGAVFPLSGPEHFVVMGLLITNGCFVLAAWLLYRLGLVMLQDQLLAFRSAIVFCLSPANVFFSSVYTESPFAACCFGGLLLQELNRPLQGAILFGIGTGLRSNGILNAGFLLYQCLHVTLQDMQKGTGLLQTLLANTRKHVLLTLGVAISIGPFLAFQVYAIQKECYAQGVQGGCGETDEAGQCSLSEQAEQPPAWCQASFPSVYLHVQKKYWQGGMFCYWQLKQAPNFLLAAPALALTALGVHHILRDFCKQLRFWKREEDLRPQRTAFSSLCRAMRLCPLLPHALHWGFLAAYLFLCANVQIATRVLGSGCPIFHWFLASLLFSRNSSKTPWLLKCYVGTFNCLGLIMHPNFLPWT